MLLRACLLAVSMAGCSDRTSVRLDIDAPGLSIASLQLTLAWDGKVALGTQLPQGGGPPKLPGSVVLLVPDVDRTAEVTLTGAETGSSPIITRAPIAIRAHQESRLSMTLSATVADLGSPLDLAAADLATVDLAAS